MISSLKDNFQENIQLQNGVNNCLTKISKKNIMWKFCTIRFNTMVYKFIGNIVLKIGWTNMVEIWLEQMGGKFGGQIRFPVYLTPHYIFFLNLKFCCFACKIEFLDCANLVGSDWVGNLKWYHTEPYVPFRWVHTKPSVHFREANTEQSIHFRKVNTEPSMHFRRDNRELLFNKMLGKNLY